MQNQDDLWMGIALSLAKEAFHQKEVPVGAVLVAHNQVIATGFNEREKRSSPLAHAEVSAIERACLRLSNWRLPECTLYTTLEPCIMCAGLLLQARVKAVVFGAFDPKGGAMGSLYSLHNDSRLNHQISVQGGFRSEECKELLQTFFKERRAKKKEFR